MHGRWWRWFSALLAVICGVAFGLTVGIGVVRAADASACNNPMPVRSALAQAAAAANHALSRPQPSSASCLR